MLMKMTLIGRTGGQAVLLFSLLSTGPLLLAQPTEGPDLDRRGPPEPAFRNREGGPEVSRRPQRDRLRRGWNEGAAREDWAPPGPPDGPRDEDAVRPMARGRSGPGPGPGVGRPMGPWGVRGEGFRQGPPSWRRNRAGNMGRFGNRFGQGPPPWAGRAGVASRRGPRQGGQERAPWGPRWRNGGKEMPAGNCPCCGQPRGGQGRRFDGPPPRDRD